MRIVEHYRGKAIYEYPIKGGVAYTGKDELGKVCRDLECSYRWIDAQIAKQKASFTGFMATYQRTPSPTPTTEETPISSPTTPQQPQPQVTNQNQTQNQTQEEKKAQTNPIWWLPIIAIIILLLAWAFQKRKKRVRW